MTPLLSLVVYMAIVTWATLLAASVIRAEGWTVPGMMLMTGNRDNLPTPSPLAGRADRAARNTQENFMLFVALAIVAHVAGAAQSPKVLLGAEVFFWSRLVYLPVYYVGVPVLRTVIWGVSIVGLAMMIMAMPPAP